MKMLRTASQGSNFTGSYKKWVYPPFWSQKKFGPFHLRGFHKNSPIAACYTLSKFKIRTLTPSRFKNQITVHSNYWPQLQSSALSVS